VREPGEWGKHRTEATEGGWDWWRKLLVNAGLPVREPGEWGKHRTEVTEATEGDWDWWRKLFSERWGFQCENQANGESIAQRSRRPQRGIGIGGESCLVNAGASSARTQANGESIAQRSQRGLGLVAKAVSERRASSARTRRMGKASHRGHRGHGGGLGLVAKELFISVSEPELRRRIWRGLLNRGAARSPI
jgi:hypothetical protein